MLTRARSSKTAETTAAPPPKRGRGRPSKKSAQTTEPEIIPTETNGTEIIPAETSATEIIDLTSDSTSNEDISENCDELGLQLNCGKAIFENKHVPRLIFKHDMNNAEVSDALAFQAYLWKDDVDVVIMEARPSAASLRKFNLKKIKLKDVVSGTKKKGVVFLREGISPLQSESEELKEFQHWAENSSRLRFGFIRQEPEILFSEKVEFMLTTYEIFGDWNKLNRTWVYGRFFCSLNAGIVVDNLLSDGRENVPIVRLHEQKLGETVRAIDANFELNVPSKKVESWTQRDHDAFAKVYANVRKANIRNCRRGYFYVRHLSDYDELEPIVRRIEAQLRTQEGMADLPNATFIRQNSPRLPSNLSDTVIISSSHLEDDLSGAFVFIWIPKIAKDMLGLSSVMMEFEISCTFEIVGPKSVKDAFQCWINHMDGHDSFVGHNSKKALAAFAYGMGYANTRSCGYQMTSGLDCPDFRSFEKETPTRPYDRSRPWGVKTCLKNILTIHDTGNNKTISERKAYLRTKYDVPLHAKTLWMEANRLSL